MLKISLTVRDTLFIVGIALSCLALGLVWPGLALAFGVAVLVAVQCLTLRRLQRQGREIVQQVKRAELQNYRQTEQLIWLSSVLKIRAPLPAMRGWAISPDFATLLVSRLREQRPRLVLELGSGVSSLVIGYCLDEIGHGSLLSVDHDETFVRTSRAAVSRHGLDHRVSIIHAPLENVVVAGRTWPWYALSTLGPRRAIDMLVVDGPPRTVGSLARYPALPLLIDWFSDGAEILVDDGNRADEREMVARWAREFPGTGVQFVATEAGSYIVTVEATRGTSSGSYRCHADPDGT